MDLSDTAWTIEDGVRRLRAFDFCLAKIRVSRKKHSDSELEPLIRCLHRRPMPFREVHLDGNLLTDEMGALLATFLAGKRFDIEALHLENNQFTTKTYLALAVALADNVSLKFLTLYGNQQVDRRRVDAEFVETLRLEPRRERNSLWQLYKVGRSDFARLKIAADALGPPSMLSQLRRCEINPFAIKRHGFCFF